MFVVHLYISLFPSTVYSPVLIIMEFAEHGNLKDYLVSLCRIVQTKPSDSTSIISSPYDHSVPTELSSVGADPLSRSSTPVSSDEGCFTKGVSEECQCSSEGGRNVTMEMIHSERVTRSSCNNYYNLIQNDVHNAEHFQDTPGSIEKDGCDDNDRIPPLPPLLSSKFIIESALQIAKGMEHLEKMKVSIEWTIGSPTATCCFDVLFPLFSPPVSS